MKKEEKFMREIEEKIKEMESEDYVFPKRFSTKDYIFTVFVGAVCLAFILLGAVL